METLTRTSITRRKLGPWSELLLTKNGYLKSLPKTKKGEIQSFEVLKPLPTTEEISNLRTAHFTITIEKLISDAFGTFEDLASELSDWYDNLPEQFQNGDKGQEVSDAKEAFEGLEAPEVPEDAGKLTTIYIPYEWIESKEQRKNDAISRLEAAIEKLQEIQETEFSKEDSGEDFSGFISSLEGAKDEVEGIEIPEVFS